MTATEARTGAGPLVALNALWIGIQFQDAALLAIVVPALLLRLSPANHTVVLSAVASVAAIAATLAPPLAGALSDRAARHAGDRRVQTAAAMACDAAALVAMAFAATTGQLTAALVVATLALNAGMAIYQVLLPEVVPRSAWGAASGVRGGLTLAGTVAGLGAAAFFEPDRALVVTAAVVLATTLTLALIPRSAPAPTRRERARVRDRRDLIVTMIARGWITLGLSLLNTYVLYFFADVLHVHQAARGTAFVAGAALVGAIASSVVAGIVSDRVERRFVVAAAGLPMVLAALGFALAPTATAIFAYAGLFGLGFGAVFSVGWALALDAVPAIGDVARDLGAWFSISNLPSVIAPILGGFVLTHAADPGSGYRILFVLASASFAAGSLTVLGVGRRA